MARHLSLLIPKPERRAKAERKPIRRAITAKLTTVAKIGRRQKGADSGEVRTKKRRSPLKIAQDRLWDHFRAFVKARDGNTCFSCGQEGLEGSNWHAGHMFPAGGSNILRYHALNVHSQCYRCNINLGGNGAEYASRFLEVYGVDQFAYLSEVKKQQKQWREPDIRELIEALKKGGADYELKYAEMIGSVYVPAEGSLFLSTKRDSTQRKTGSTF
jgi:hypothetical protein